MPVANIRVFCPACGLQVEPALGFEGAYRTISCSICDLLLESKLDPSSKASHDLDLDLDPDPDPDDPPLVTGTLAGGKKPVSTPSTLLDTVIAAEDTDGMRKILVKILTDRRIAREIVPAVNGEELLVHYHRSVASGRTVSLLILDVNMPILNGINAAIGVRAAERAYGSAKPTPILFFTSTLCDESFKRVLQFTAPSRYLNKGADGTPEQFADRLLSVVQRLLHPTAAGLAGASG